MKRKFAFVGLISLTLLVASSIKSEAIIVQAEGNLKNIESLLGRVETQKLIMERDSDDLGKLMFEYAQGMKAAFDAALKEADMAAKSQGKQGSVDALGNFESVAKAHEPRLKQIEARTRAIEAQLKVGTVKLDRALLQKMAPGDRREFQKFLSPPGLQEMQKLHPEFFKPGLQQSPMTPPTKQPGSFLNPVDGVQMAGAVAGFCRAFPEQISTFLVSPAEAGIAAPCIPVCLAKNWSACVSCIAGKGPAAINAWNTFVGRWNGCGKCWKPWTWPCKAVALVKLIAALA